MNIFVSFFHLKATKRLPICNKAYYHLNKEWGYTTKKPNKRYKMQLLNGGRGIPGYRNIKLNQSIICFQGYIWRGDICRLLSINLKIQQNQTLDRHFPPPLTGYNSRNGVQTCITIVLDLPFTQHSSGKRRFSLGFLIPKKSKHVMSSCWWRLHPGWGGRSKLQP